MHVESLATARLIFNGLICVSERAMSRKRLGVRIILGGHLKGVSFDEGFQGGAANTLIRIDCLLFPQCKSLYFLPQFFIEITSNLFQSVTIIFSYEECCNLIPSFE